VEGDIGTVSSTEPVGLLHVVLVYEHQSVHRVVCHARCVSPERAVLVGESVVPVDSPSDHRTAPARIVRIHREPVGEFPELPPGWSAAVELEGPDVSWVQPRANLRVVPPAAGADQDQAG